MMDLYINGMACISPQPTFGSTDFPFAVQKYESGRLACIEPDYAPFIDPKVSRRMGRLLKYGTTAGLMALRDAGVAAPDAISTGTGFGLLDDSGKFLKNVTEADEGVVSPTAFIQSTHNTVSSNIALIAGCRGPNNTFVHKGFSFESALTDLQMLMTENRSIRQVLAGAYDETTDYSYAIMKRLRLIREEPASSLDLLKAPGSGTLAGEGAAFFALSETSTDHSYARILGNAILYHPRSAGHIQSKLDSFLAAHRMTVSDVDIVISGLCGDTKRDELLHAVNAESFTAQTILGYKHLCGEYMTSSAFALWTGAMILQSGAIPHEMMLKDRKRPHGSILIHNAYKKDHTFILLNGIEQTSTLGK